MMIAKGPSKNVNIFTNVQTVHFFRPFPLPLKCTHSAFWDSETRVLHSTIQ